MSKNMEELKKDAEELALLIGQAQRTNIKDILTIAKHKIDTEIVNLEIKQKSEKLNSGISGSSSINTALKRFYVELNEYAWDQSEKFVKLFVSLQGVQALTENDVYLKFSNGSMKLIVENLNNKDYHLTINNLLYPIIIEKSYYKIKTDMIAVYIKKTDNGKHWSHLTSIQKRAQDLKEHGFKNDNSDNPTDGILNMIKKMYDEGDSETKRMIGKAWSQQQDKGELGMDKI